MGKTKPINDLEAWLASKNAANQNRWEAYYQRYREEELKRKKGANSEKTPAIYLPVSQWDFEPVVDGTSVVHDFVVQNKGDAPLNISKVKTG